MIVTENQKSNYVKFKIMKTLWSKFYNSRIGQYVIYGITYLVWWKLAGFEFAVIICLTTILGEMHFQNMNRK